MVLRAVIFLAATAGLQSVAMAADFGNPKILGRQNVPGAFVTVESGVRVIRPVPFDPAWVVSDETPIPGGVVYHGAAIYRVPHASPARSAHKEKAE